MTKRTTPILGALLCIAGVTVAVAVGWHLAELEESTRWRDEFGMIPMSSGSGVLVVSTVECPRVMTVSGSQPLVVRIAFDDESSPSPPDGVSVSVTVEASAFDIGGETTKKLHVLSDGQSELGWVVSPKSLGEHAIAISIDGTEDENISRVNGNMFRTSWQTRAVTVTSLFGLSLSTVTLIGWLTSFLGGAITLPWIIQQIQKRRASSPPEPPKSKIIIP